MGSLIGTGTSESNSTSLSFQQTSNTSNAASGANSKVLTGNGAVSSDSAKKVLTGNAQDRSQKGSGNFSAGKNLKVDQSSKVDYGNHNVINPDSTALTQKALDTVGAALQTAIANRDVIAPPGSDVTQIGTETPTTGLVDSVKGFLSSRGVMLILAIGFPVIFGLLYFLWHRRKKTA